MIKYVLPKIWVKYDLKAIASELVTAKASVISLINMPCQRSWADALQKIKLKQEVAGTSRIEGADFTDSELEAALSETPEKLATRSQRQAAAAVSAYRWIAGLPNDRPIDGGLIREVHRRMITGADDDHCPAGQIRQRDQNVNFGTPRHRGCEGGVECEKAFESLCNAIRMDFRSHDPLIQALALHYHFAAMHPFLDGNGRTARALEAVMLQRVGLRDTLFIAMSNFYYEEKPKYLEALASVRAFDHDLTPFLILGLRGITTQCGRLLEEIQKNVRKALFRNVMYDLFQRLKSPRTRTMGERHLKLLRIMLSVDEIPLDELMERSGANYAKRRNPRRAAIKDINYLLGLKAIGYNKLPDGQYQLHIRLEWPTEITETEFFERVQQMPKAKSHTFLG